MKRILFTFICIVSALSPAVTFAAGGTLGNSNNTSTLTNGLVGYWSMDGNKTNWLIGTTQDSSGQGNSGSLVGMSTTTSPTVGKVAGTLNFDGSSSYIDVPDNSSLNTFTGMTYSVWVKPSATVTTQDMGTGAWHDAQIEVETNNTIKVCMWAGGETCVTAATGIVYGNWYQVVMDYDNSTHTLQSYVNGLAGASVGATKLYPSAGLFYSIGQQDTTSGGTTAYFSGALDDVRIYNRALSRAEISQLYTTGLATAAHSNNVTLSSGLAGYWPFDGNTTVWSTGKTIDISGNGNTGQFVSMSTTTSPAAGKVGGALKFAGTNVSQHYVQVKTGSIISGLTSWTMAAWVNIKANGGTTGEAIYVERASSGSDIVKLDSLDTVSAHNAVVTIRNDGGTLLQQRGTKVIDDGKWHYVVGVKNGTTVTLYVDGQTDTSGTWVGTETFTNAGLISRIGGDAGDSNANVNGGIDDVRVYNRALSAQEVQQLYNTGAVNIAHSNPGLVGSGLVGNWTFDGPKINWATGAIADSSGQGNTGQMVSMSTSTSPTAGKIGQALNFNGAGYVTVSASTPAALDLTTLTVSVWERKSNTALTTGTLVSTGLLNNNKGFEIQCLANAISMQRFKVGGNEQVNFNTTACTTATWHHVVVTIAGTVVTYYLDGALVGSDSTSWTAPINSYVGTPFRIGIRPDLVQIWQGSLDDVRIYNRVLSAQEVQQLYSSGR